MTPKSKEELDLKSRLINTLQIFDLSPDDFKYGSTKSNLDDFWRLAKKAIDSYHQQQLEQAVQLFRDKFDEATRRGENMTVRNRVKYARDNETLGESYARTQGFKSGMLVAIQKLTELQSTTKEDKSNDEH